MAIKRVIILVLALVTGFGAAGLASATDWQTYRNHDHGFSLDYPADLFDRRDKAAFGEGVVFSSDDGRRKLAIYGFHNGDELPMKTVRDIVVENYVDREITYERLKGNWLVLSGYETIDGEQMIFYNRLESNRAGNRFSAFEFTWPVAGREKIDPLLKRMTDSLGSPTGR